ncbi:amidophosphoribosyltransferase [mine drainage metagenome]|uniref:Amidophosphoribosyltransferase n=1 Tax=mine drainage metagenome TaxID=410659 RepID=T0ZV16_9ZZZZ
MPPIRAPCYFGVDMKVRKDLVAADRTEEEVSAVIGADSVHYLSISGLVEALNIKAESLCLGCLTGATRSRSRRNVTATRSRSRSSRVWPARSFCPGAGSSFSSGRLPPAPWRFRSRRT